MQIIILGNCTQWLDYCLKDINKMSNIKFINSLYPCKNKISMKLAQFNFSQKINKKVHLPFKKLWFPYFCKNICKNKNEEIILVVYDWNRLSNNEDFLKYIKNYFKNIKLVYVLTNIIEITYAYRNNFVDKLNDYYDLVYAFDQKDSDKYGFLLTQLLYSYIDVNSDNYNGKVFFAGSAKDRLNSLIESYDKFKELGIECNYHILNVPEENIIEREGIEYNNPIPYEDVVKQTKASSCIVEFKQGNSNAFTIKVCEAIFYDKILITTNHNITNLPFYDKRFMFVIDNPSDIKKEFFDYKDNVKYSEDAKYYFSVKRFINEIIDKLKIKE